jgi:hypothetical protein
LACVHKHTHMGPRRQKIAKPSNLDCKNKKDPACTAGCNVPE